MDKFSVYVACFALFFVSCGSPNPDKKETNPKIVEAKDSIIEQKEPPPTVPFGKDRYFNDIARFMAGLPQTQGSSFELLEKKEDWIQFSKSFDSSWYKLAIRLKKMDTWRKKELADANANPSVVFYPFSGPDFLNEFTFFPSAHKTVMIGLEPAGSVPDFATLEKDTLTGYFKSIRKTLSSIMKFSFFRTLSMEKDLKSVELDGTLPIMLIFMARTGNTILGVKPVSIDSKGQLVLKEIKKGTKNPFRGVQIQYLNNIDTAIKELTYFSADLGDAGLSKDSSILQYLASYPFTITYLKSASYLMHKAYFSKIRSLILKQTQKVLQDDSGIPYRFFKNNQWVCQAYGTYDKPINLFSNWFQDDYKKLFDDSTQVKPLTFGIGYDWRPNESNLLYAVKTNASKK